MGFWSGIAIGLSIGILVFAICLFMFCSGTLNKETEAYQKGFYDGINSVKNNENERD